MKIDIFFCLLFYIVFICSVELSSGNDKLVYGDYTYNIVFNKLHLHSYGYTIDNNTLVQLIFKGVGVSVTCGYVIYANDKKNINVVVLLKKCTDIINKDCIENTCHDNYSSLFFNNKFDSESETVNPNILLIYANKSTVEFNDKGVILQTGDTNKADSTVKQTDSTVKQTDSTVKQTDSTVKQTDSTVKHTDSTVNGSSNKFTVDQEVKYDNKKCKISKVHDNTKKYDINCDDGSENTNVDEDKISLYDSFLSNYGTTAALGVSAAALGIGAYHLLKSKKKRKSKDSSPKKQKRSSKKRSSRHRSRGRK
jgi:hypothetical protein